MTHRGLYIGIDFGIWLASFNIAKRPRSPNSIVRYWPVHASRCDEHCAKAIDGRNDRDGNPGGNQSVFNGGCARLILQKRD
jgi:hypothetical protein